MLKKLPSMADMDVDIPINSSGGGFREAVRAVRAALEDLRSQCGGGCNENRVRTSRDLSLASMYMHACLIIYNLCILVGLCVCVDHPFCLLCK